MIHDPVKNIGPLLFPEMTPEQKEKLNEVVTNHAIEMEKIAAALVNIRS